MDTGATHHMIGNNGDLDMVTPLKGDQKITVGSLPVKTTGSSSIKTAILQGNKDNSHDRKE